jgi:hypothetical protein
VYWFKLIDWALIGDWRVDGLYSYILDLYGTTTSFVVE